MSAMSLTTWELGALKTFGRHRASLHFATRNRCRLTGTSGSRCRSRCKQSVGEKGRPAISRLGGTRGVWKRRLLTSDNQVCLYPALRSATRLKFAHSIRCNSPHRDLHRTLSITSTHTIHYDDSPNCELDRVAQIIMSLARLIADVASSTPVSCTTISSHHGVTLPLTP